MVDKKCQELTRIETRFDENCKKTVKNCTRGHGSECNSVLFLSNDNLFWPLIQNMILDAFEFF